MLFDPLLRGQNAKIVIALDRLGLFFHPLGASILRVPER